MCLGYFLQLNLFNLDQKQEKRNFQSLFFAFMKPPTLRNKRVESQVFDIVKDMDALSHLVLYFHHFESQNVNITWYFVAHPNEPGDLCAIMIPNIYIYI